MALCRQWYQLILFIRLMGEVSTWDYCLDKADVAMGSAVWSTSKYWLLQRTVPLLRCGIQLCRLSVAVLWTMFDMEVNL